jgi:peptidoglycan-associated lipoprotein
MSKEKDHGAEICAYCYVREVNGARPKEVKMSKDSTNTYAHPTISPDGKFLYFVSDWLAAMAERIIWRSAVEGDKYGAPVNLVPQINTPGDEMFPYNEEDSTLYFSSNGHPGFEGCGYFSTPKEERRKLDTS